MKLVAPLEGHRIWSQTYDSGPNPLLALESRVLAEYLPPLRGRRFVDIACGTGRWTAHAQSHGAQAAGIDLCHEMLRQAAPKARLAGCLTVAAAEMLPLAEAVSDVTLCSFAIGYMPGPSAVIREMARVTAPGAMVIVSDLHPAALQAGWTRSFRDGDAAYEIEHCAHSSAALFAAAQDAGLRLDHHLEPHFGQSERKIFFNAGKDHLFPQVSRIPAVWIAIWTRPCN